MVTNHIRVRRKKAILTQQELAQRIDLDQGALSKMERGRRAVTIDHLFLLAKALDCLPSEFVNDEAFLAQLDQDCGTEAVPPPVALQAILEHNKQKYSDHPILPQ